ncbi:Crp/Fnr family transcriptional regulator [Sulfurospirillum arcachonense]|uniref:Crp/Fnr family transcriptional regulator n=1 Tax=Sulfurospirillum arcachonense TaxID=57666 RepID=UPI0004B00078|nr:Crp/Fnr family transcriptional regulator [Sulfurospirillum arcachonense]
MKTIGIKLEEQLLVLYTALNDISPISIEVWKEIKPFFHSVSLETSEYLFKSGDIVEDFFFLTSGLARYYYPREDGKEFNKSFAVKKGHLLSSISSVAKQEPSAFSVEILSHFECLSIKYKDFLMLGDKFEEWNHLTLRIYEALTVKKERREADFLLLSATQRYQKFLEEYSEVVDVLPNYHIASYLGITEVGLSRIRGSLGLT